MAIRATTFLLLFIMHLGGFSQVLWDKTIGGENREVGFAVEQYNGNIYVFSSSSSDNTGDKVMSRYGSQFTFSTWIIVLDSNKTIIDQKQIGGDDNDILADVTKVDDGFLLLHQSSSGISHDKTTSAFGPADFWLVKVDFALNIVWQKQFGSTVVDQSHDIVLDNSGNIFISGQSNGGIHPSGNRTALQKGIFDTWIIKLDRDGNELWQKSLGGNGVESGGNMATDFSNNIFVAVSSDSEPSLDKTKDTIGNGDLWICKLNSNGDLINQTVLGGENREFASTGGLFFVANQIILVSGSQSGISGNKTTQNYGEDDVWIVSLDSNLNINWQTSLGGNQLDYANGFYYSEARNTLFVGITSSSGTSGNKTVANQGAFDFWLVELDLNGNIINQFSAGGLADDRVGSILEYKNQLLVAGSSSSPSGFGDKTEPSRGDQDIWLTAFDVALSTPELSANRKTLALYPNPASNACYLSGIDKPVSYGLYSITGALAQQGVTQFEIPFSNLNAGIYILKVDGYQPQRLVVE